MVKIVSKGGKIFEGFLPGDRYAGGKLTHDGADELNLSLGREADGHPSVKEKLFVAPFIDAVDKRRNNEKERF